MTSILVINIYFAKTNEKLFIIKKNNTINCINYIKFFQKTFKIFGLLSTVCNNEANYDLL